MIFCITSNQIDRFFLSQANCIDSTATPEAVFASEVKKMSAENMKPQEQLTLEPYERDHAVVVGIYRYANITISEINFFELLPVTKWHKVENITNHWSVMKLLIFQDISQILNYSMRTRSKNFCQSMVTHLPKLNNPSKIS